VLDINTEYARLSNLRKSTPNCSSFFSATDVHGWHLTDVFPPEEAAYSIWVQSQRAEIEKSSVKGGEHADAKKPGENKQLEGEQIIYILDI